MQFFCIVKYTGLKQRHIDHLVFFCDEMCAGIPQFDNLFKVQPQGRFSVRKDLFDTILKG